MKIISKNKDAFFNYELLDRFEAGIQLLGWEVKSIRSGHANLKGAFCSFQGDELFVSNLHISQYMNVIGDETRPRKLLLHKSQIKKLRDGTKTKGYTVVATSLRWSSKGLVKVDIALAKGKNMIDKRQTIKKRDLARESRNRY